MKKLEDIPKNDLFKVPEGYFETLPGRIQARVSNGSYQPERSFVFSYRLQYIVPVILIAITLGIFWYSGTDKHQDTEVLLSSVSTDDLVAYLSDSELTTEDLLENVEFNKMDLEEIEQEVYDQNIDGVESNDIIDLDLENI